MDFLGNFPTTLFCTRRISLAKQCEKYWMYCSIGHHQSPVDRVIRNTRCRDGWCLVSFPHLLFHYHHQALVDLPTFLTSNIPTFQPSNLLSFQPFPKVSLNGKNDKISWKWLPFQGILLFSGHSWIQKVFWNNRNDQIPWNNHLLNEFLIQICF